MNVLKNVKRITAGVLITALVICAVPFKSFAAAGTIYESENNNNISNKTIQPSTIIDETVVDL